MGIPKPPSPDDDNEAVPKTSLAVSSETASCDASHLPRNNQGEGKKEELCSKSPLHSIVLESFVLFRTFPSGLCLKTIAKFHLHWFSLGPRHLALCYFNATVALPSCNLLCLQSCDIIFNGYNNYTDFICFGSEKEKSQQQITWQYAGYSHVWHALPSCCAKNNNFSEEREKGKENRE